MERSFWQARWSGGQIGFHLDEVNPNLIRWWPKLVGPRPRGNVLVPLCGKALDLKWLAEFGHHVTGIEFVEQAAEDFFREQKMDATREDAPGGIVWSANDIRIHVGDFFKVTPRTIPTPDFVYDRAALVAVEPKRRAEYAQRLAALCPPDTGILLVSFVHDIGSGPPFSVEESELTQLFEGLFELEKMDDQDILEAESRFRERGATFLREQVWLGKRGVKR